MPATTDPQPIDLVQIGEPSTSESWLVSDWAAGQTTNMEWAPENVVANVDGSISLVLGASASDAARPYTGGEVQSIDASSFGTWTWTAQAPKMVDGAVFGMFAYREDHFNDPWIEFDFEFIGADTTQIRLNIHMETETGEQVTLEQARNWQPVVVDLGFDASEGMHTYEIIVTETQAHFLVDGEVVGRFGAADMPYNTWITGDMKGFTNLWCVDPSLTSWGGEWVNPGAPLNATLAAIDVRPGDLGIFEPAQDFSTYGDEIANGLSGADGDDLIYGRDGDDTISGGGGNDVLEGEGGNDALIGGAGNDILRGGEGNDALNLDTDDDLLDGGAGGDWLVASGPAAIAVDLAETSAQSTGYGTDTILNIENIAGGLGADTLSGDDAGNILVGGDGNDLINGRGGADIIIGGMGQDRLYGGVDQVRDIFLFEDITESSSRKNADVIHDFVSGIDDINLSGIDVRQDLDGDQAFGFSGTKAAAYSVWYAAGRSDLTVYADVNGDRRADFEIRVAEESSLSVDDFIL